MDGRTKALKGLQFKLPGKNLEISKLEQHCVIMVVHKKGMCLSKPGCDGLVLLWKLSWQHTWIPQRVWTEPQCNHWNFIQLRSVITCISIYVAISLLSLWSNSAPSLVFTSFQHVQKWLAWAADSHVLPAELVTGITTCGWWSLSTLLSPTALQWIFPHLLQFKLRKAWFNCTVYFTIVFFFL